jgi:hypothetical protein
MEPPVRESALSHECVCNIVNPTGARDTCHAQVWNPDQPFCDYCEAVGHAALQRLQREETR